MINPTVKILSLSVIAVLLAAQAGCSYLREQTYGLTEDQCKSRAYIQREISAYLKERFGKDAQVRLGVTPFNVDENLNRNRVDLDYGVTVASEVQRSLLSSGVVPIVEILYRVGWAGKRDDYFRGNFGSIEMARAAGYDLVLVGKVEPIEKLDELTVSSKLIESESGITLWHGTHTVTSRKKDVEGTLDWFNIEGRKPSKLYITELAKSYGECLADTLMKESDG